MDLSVAVWRKSTRSQSHGQCVEVADLTGAISVRDSKDPTGPALAFTPANFAAFVATLKRPRRQ